MEATGSREAAVSPAAHVTATHPGAAHAAAHATAHVAAHVAAAHAAAPAVLDAATRHGRGHDAAQRQGDGRRNRNNLET
jgi:hypothetical protein